MIVGVDFLKVFDLLLWFLVLLVVVLSGFFNLFIGLVFGKWVLMVFVFVLLFMLFGVSFEWM